MNAHLAGLVLGVAAVAAGQVPGGARNVTVDATTQPAEPSEALKARYTTLQELYERAAPSVVKVSALGGGKTIQSGSGFFVAKGGVLVTNWHVVNHPEVSALRVKTAGGREVRADLLAFDVKADLAVLRVTAPLTSAPVLQGRNADSVKVGEGAVTIGCPGSLALSFGKGIVSGIRTAEDVRTAIRNAMRFDAKEPDHGYKYVQTDAGVYHGNSGGPLLDLEGRVLGVATLRIPDSQLGFAIEWRAVADLLKKADPARPVDLAEVRKKRPATARGRWGKPSTVKQLALAIRQARGALYCTRCFGSGVIRVSVGTRRTVKRPGAWGGGKDSVISTKRVPRGCPICGGVGTTTKTSLLYKRLCAVASTLVRLEPGKGQTGAGWKKAGELFDDSAFHYVSHARGLMASARAVLGSPQRHVGEPTVFVGRVRAVAFEKSATYLLVRIYGSEQDVFVVSRAHITVLKGQWCAIVGLVAGAVVDSPIVLAVSVASVHPNPRRRSVK